MATKQQRPKQKGTKQKLSPKQVQQRREAAIARQEREEAAKAKKARGKRIFTLVICVILVLALGLPTIGLTLLGAGA